MQHTMVIPINNDIPLTLWVEQKERIMIEGKIVKEKTVTYRYMIWNDSEDETGQPLPESLSSKRMLDKTSNPFTLSELELNSKDTHAIPNPTTSESKRIVVLTKEDFANFMTDVYHGRG